MSYHNGSSSSSSPARQSATNTQRQTAPPGYHYMANGTLMLDADMENSKPAHRGPEPLCGQQYPFTRNTINRPCNAEELSRGCVNGMQSTCQCPGSTGLEIIPQEVNTYSVPCPPGQCRCMSGPCGAGCCDDKYAIKFMYSSIQTENAFPKGSVTEQIGYFSVQMPSAQPRPNPDTKNKICQCYTENKTDSTKLDAVSFDCAGKNGTDILGLNSAGCCDNLVPAHIIEKEPCIQARVFSDDTPCPPGQCRCMSGPCGAGCCKNAYAVSSQQQ